MKTTDWLIEASDRCTRISQHGRRLVDELSVAIGSEAKEPYSRIAASGRELVDELEALSRDLLNKVVELDTERDKSAPLSTRPPSTITKT